MELVNCKARQTPCDECPFTAGGVKLLPDTMAEITDYLAKGQNHLCHKDQSNHTVCRGGRDFQLRLWCSLGIIQEPTDEALREAMRKMGIEPAKHV